MFRLILFNTWTFVNVTSTRTDHNSAGLSEPVLQYILYRFWQFSWNDNMCKWKTWKVSSNTMGGHVVVAVWFPSKSPLHVLLLPVPVSLRSNKDVMVIRGRCWQEVLFTAVAFSYISPNRSHLIWNISFKNKLREFDKRSTHFFSLVIILLVLINWQCMDIIRRKLVLVTIGT